MKSGGPCRNRTCDHLIKSQVIATKRNGNSVTTKGKKALSRQHARAVLVTRLEVGGRDPFLRQQGKTRLCPLFPGPCFLRDGLGGAGRATPPGALDGWMAGAVYDATGSYTWSYVNAIAFNVMNLTIAVSLLRRYTRLRTNESLENFGAPGGA